MSASNPLYLVIAFVYYVLIALLTFLSIFGIYVLVRYGRSKPLALTAAFFYLVMFLILLQQSYSTLQSLK